MARFNLVNEVDCTFDRYGHCGVSCSMRAGRVVVVCQIFNILYFRFKLKQCWHGTCNKASKCDIYHF